MSEQLQQVIDRVVAHLAEVLATTAGQPVRALPAVGQSTVDWQVPVVVGGAFAAEMTLGVSAAAAGRLTSLILMTEDEHPDGDVADTLKEIVSQATAAYVNQDSPGVTIAVGTPVRRTASPPAGAVQHDLVMDGDEPPRLVMWTNTAAPAARAGAPVSAAGAAAPRSAMAGGAPLTPGGRNLDVVLDLELPITVRFGATRLTLDALSRLGPGSLIDLERSPDEPVELLVNGRLVARGEVVVVSGCYGVRVRDVVSRADRLRSLEG